MDADGYVLAGGAWWWVVVDISWMVVPGGGWWWIYCDWWWVVVDVGGYILAVVDGGAWWWVVVDGGGWWCSLVEPIIYSTSPEILRNPCMECSYFPKTFKNNIGIHFCHVLGTVCVSVSPLIF